jgi:mRNA-degrading endonuclease YafQ of YafQ-DinJ toxin-antitoxin module
MKAITLSPTFQKKLQTLQLLDKQLVKKIHKQLQLFVENPKHPSLRLHKLRGNLQNTWSLSVTTSFRLLFIEDTEYYFFDMGEHDEIYR